MQLTITAKIKILPDIDGQAELSETRKAYTASCNFVSKYIFETHDLKFASINKALYHKVRAKFGLRSQMAQSVIKTALARYKTIAETQGEWTMPAFKHPEYDLVWNRDYYSLKNSLFSVNTLNGRLKLQYKDLGMEQYFDGKWSFGTAKLVHKHKKWFLHIPVTKDIPECNESTISNVVGCDLGVNFLVTTYNSDHKTTFVSGRDIKHRRAQYARTRKELQQVRTPSSRRRLKAVGSRENRWIQDVNHRVSKALVESNPAGTLFVLEDLTGVRNATEKVVLKNRYVTVSWAFFDLRKKLEYKASMTGSKVITVSPKYTSQTCPVCGHTEKTNRDKKNHLFTCKACGYRSNDDRIGAMNLYHKGINYLADKCRPDNAVPDTVVA